MQTLVTAAFNSAIPKNAPGEIIYIPVGSNRISATVSGRPGEVTVNVPAEKGAAIAAALQTALDRRIASPVRPRLAFDHSRSGPASGHPSAFSFDPARGIILSANWSNSGRAAIEGGDYGYFSPTFLISDDGTPSGLPDKGEIGSLVDEPAFRSIGLIAAADSDINLIPEKQEPNIMSKLIFAALAISAAADNAETEAIKAIDHLKIQAADATAKLATVQAANAELLAKVQAAAKDRAESIVSAAVADGRLLPKDEAKQAKFREKIEAGDTFAEEILAQLPRLNQGLDKPLVFAADGKPVAASDFEGKARLLVSAGSATSLDEAFGIVAAADPTSYGEYLKTLA